jgi:hypothetical protein
VQVVGGRERARVEPLAAPPGDQARFNHFVEDRTKCEIKPGAKCHFLGIHADYKSDFLFFLPTNRAIAGNAPELVT